MIDFPQHIIEAAKTHARAEYPRESCGIVSAGVYRPCANIADEPTKTFLIDPREYVGLTGMRELKAVIHSHPDWYAVPSAKDMRSQFETPDIPWGILGVTETEISDIQWFGANLPVAPLVGRKFIHGVQDCYSIIYDCYRLGREGMADPSMWPNFHPCTEWPFDPATLLIGARDYEWWLQGGNLYEENFAQAGFRQIGRSEVRVGDVLLFSVMPPNWTGPRVTNHGSVFLGHGLMLHHLWSNPEKRAVQRVSLAEPYGPWMKHFQKALRYEP